MGPRIFPLAYLLLVCCLLLHSLSTADVEPDRV
jgi:hypothetical protein